MNKNPSSQHKCNQNLDMGKYIVTQVDFLVFLVDFPNGETFNIISS